MVSDAAENGFTGFHDYAPFGEEALSGYAGRTGNWGTLANGTDYLNQRYTAAERDTESTLDFMQARYLANQQARFVSVDPAGNFVADPTNPQTWNMYGYTASNPLAFVDPTGMGWWSDLWNSITNFFSGCGGGAMFCTTVYGLGDADLFSSDLFGILPEFESGLFPFLQGSSVGGGAGVSASAPGPGQAPSGLRSAYCSTVPSGRSTSVGVAFGGLGSVSGSVDTVFNYNSGQTSVFATGGGAFGWNGGASLTVSTGLVYGLDATNNGFSGPFKGASFYGPTPLPLVGAGGSITQGGGVTVVSAGISGALAAKVGGGFSWTNTTRPLNVGNFTEFSLADYLGYLLRRPCS
jgi:RHS repeat-associated protein